MPLFSIPLSGLTAASSALSVISNNLANLNTDGFKDQTTTFRDVFYQTAGSSGSGNPIQVGNGVQVQSVLIQAETFAVAAEPEGRHRPCCWK